MRKSSRRLLRYFSLRDLRIWQLSEFRPSSSLDSLLLFAGGGTRATLEEGLPSLHAPQASVSFHSHRQNLPPWRGAAEGWTRLGLSLGCGFGGRCSSRRVGGCRRRAWQIAWIGALQHGLADCR